MDTVEVNKVPGIPAQGNADPLAMFGDHAVAFMTGKYYDPSYGKIYLSLQDMESQAVEGYIRNGVPVPGPGGTQIPCIFIRKNGPSVGITEGDKITY